MVTDRRLFHPQIILLDPDDPLSYPPYYGYHGEVNTGTWFQEAKHNKFTQPNHILMPFCPFIDVFLVDKYEKLTIEAVLTGYMWLNRKAQSRATAWWVHGFVQDQKLFLDQQIRIHNDKAQDYHGMLSTIFQ